MESKFDILRGMNETLAELIDLDLVSPALANDVLKGEIDVEEAQRFYYYEKLYSEM